MPSPQEKIAIRDDDPPESLDVAGIVSLEVADADRLEPGGRDAVARPNVDTRRLVTDPTLLDRLPTSGRRGRGRLR